MKRIICAMFAFLLLLSLAGCMPEDEVEYVQPVVTYPRPSETEATADDETEPPETQPIVTEPTTPNDLDSHVGTWHATVDFGKALGELCEKRNFKKYLVLDDIRFDVVLELTPDGTYRRYLDPRTAEQFLEKVDQVLKRAVYQYYVDYLVQNDSDMSPEDFLAYYGYTLDSYVEKHVTGENFHEKLRHKLEKTCSYRLAGKRLYEWNEGEKETERYETVSLKRLTMTVSASSEEDDFFNLYPIEYSRTP